MVLDEAVRVNPDIALFSRAFTILLSTEPPIGVSSTATGLPSRAA